MRRLILFRFFWVIFLVLLTWLIGYWLFVGTKPQKYPGLKITDWIGKRRFELKENGEIISFDLLDPEQAPPSISENVMLGYKIFNNPRKYASKYAGDRVTCTNCHLYGGNTLGGKNSGIPLVGVTSVYPKFSQRDNKMIDLADRVNNCFERSLNGRPLPKNSPEMEGILDYLLWISCEVASVKNPHWLGIDAVESTHTPDAKQGAVVYKRSCSICHGNDGNGSKNVPPLWGPDSFNDGAGMCGVEMFAGFVFANMPYQQPTLTPDEALDVAAFVTAQQRPLFKKKHKNQSLKEKEPEK